MCIQLSNNYNLCNDKNTRPFKNTSTASSFNYVKFAKCTTYIYTHVKFTRKYIPQVGAKIYNNPGDIVRKSGYQRQL